MTELVSVADLRKHGRLKVKTSAEQAEAKRKEREKKVKVYQGATAKIFQKRAAGEKDQEIIDLTGQILSANPDFYTLWNVRREVFVDWKSNRTEEDMVPVFENELSFLEACLHVNPKGYGIWQHRCWVMDHHSKPNWSKELHLCNKYLEFDERNFHCWDYRRFVVQRSDVSADKEFDYTTEKISANFSNYSSWHYRSKLLPKVHADPGHPVGVQEEVLLQEFELAQNAFFTDPNDQSAWFYHRWLLGRGERELRVECITVEGDRCVAVFNKHLQEKELRQFELLIDDEVLDVAWKLIGPSNFSKIWETSLNNKIDPAKDHQINVRYPGKNVNFTFPQGGSGCFWRQTYKQGARFSYELSAATSSTLSSELESCLQLHELEPENKWTLLTVVLLMRAIDPLAYESQMVEHLNTLEGVDATRRAYYRDLRSKFLIENAIERQPADSRDLDLSSLGLTSLFHLDHLSHVTNLDVSNNSITCLNDMHYLQSLKTLNLRNNTIDTTLEELQDVVPSLREMNL